MIPIDPDIHQQLVQRVEHCGVDLGNVRISYDDELQSEVILVTAKSLTDKQLECLENSGSIQPYPIVMFEDSELASRASEFQSQRGLALAKEWLDERGLLEKMPTYDPTKEAPADFAERAEAFCGYAPGAILELNKVFGILTLKQGYLEDSIRGSASADPAQVEREEEKFMCLMNVMSVTSATSDAMKFGLIGNDAVQTKD